LPHHKRSLAAGRAKPEPLFRSDVITSGPLEAVDSELIQWQVEMQTIKYRLFEPRLAPRRTKLEMPGWGGNPEPRRDGSHEYAWHCVPFTEGAQYGIEIFYPYPNELHVTQQDARVVLTGDFGPDPGSGIRWPPFRTFGENYYTYQLLLISRSPKLWQCARSLTRATIHRRRMTCRSPCRPCYGQVGGR